MLAIAVSHAWSWFEVHTTQRQNYVNFYLIAIAFLSAGYVGAFTNHFRFLAATVACLGAAVSVAFYLIDLRNRELIHAGERPLKELQDRLAAELQLDSLRIIESVERPRYSITSLGRVVRTVHVAGAITFAVGAVYAAVAG